METSSVILDSCVIYPMPLCDTLFRAAEANLYRVYFSQEILDGATRNLVKKGRMTDEKAARFQEMIKNNFPEGMVEVPTRLVESMTNHPGDRHVVAAAIVAKAEIIVTANLKHFPVEALAPYGIEAQHPDVFLTQLYDNNPDSIVQVIRQQCEALKRPPCNVAELLEKLEKNNQLQVFASNVRLYEFLPLIIQTSKEALRLLGTDMPEGGRFYDGELYLISQRGQTLLVKAKDGRGEIMRVQDEQIDGNLSSQDVKAFQNFDRTLQQELKKHGDRPQENEDLSL